MTNYYHIVAIETRRDEMKGVGVVGFGGGFERFGVGRDSMEVINSMSLTYGAHGDAISNYHTQAIFREEKEESRDGCELSQPDKAFN
ncbi:hypothetical protein M0804_005343 [Polistes exclamans]|nr:hypothetical protein M0804_005343 [Polistes exclamans]